MTMRLHPRPCLCKPWGRSCPFPRWTRNAKPRPAAKLAICPLACVARASVPCALFWMLDRLMEQSLSKGLARLPQLCEFSLKLFFFPLHSMCEETRNAPSSLRKATPDAPHANQHAKQSGPSARQPSFAASAADWLRLRRNRGAAECFAKVVTNLVHEPQPHGIWPTPAHRSS